MKLGRYITMLVSAFAAVLAFSVVGIASASATEPVWIVNKVVLKAGEKVLTASEQKGVQTLKGPGLEVVCQKEKDKGELIGGRPGTDLTTETVYTECTAKAPAGCLVHSSGQPAGTIALNVPINTKLVWKERGQFLNEFGELEGTANGEVLDLFVPAKQPYVTLTLEKCNESIRNGTYNVEGEVLAETGHLNASNEFVKGTAFANPPEEFEEGVLKFPCPRLTQYWTGDEDMRTSHTIKALSVFFFGQSEYCGETKNWIVNAKGERTKQLYGITNE